jgi:hypothetical protein
MWKKILLGVAALIVLVVALALFLTSSLTEVADKQLKALRSGDVIAAYAFTSGDFRNSTSLANFEKFVNNNPSLKRNLKSSWDERSIENNTGTLTGSLTAVDGTVTPVEYRFIKENGEWKIKALRLQPSGMQVAPNPSNTPAPSPAPAKPAAAAPAPAVPPAAPTAAAAPAPAPAPASNAYAGGAPASSTDAADVARGELVKILISDTLGGSGNVDAPKGIVSRFAPKVYVSAYILHAKKGLKVGAEMVRVDNGAKLGPSIATVSQNGNVIRNFSFTNTENVWPVGDYVINIATSNRQYATVNFKVE